MIQSFFNNIRSTLLQNLNKSEENIIIAVYWFTNRELFEVLLNKLKTGVDVKLIIHNDFINNRENGLPFQEFMDHGGEFYFSDNKNPMHNKFCVIDEKILINGSYNWTYFAEEKNRENILVIKEAKQVVKSFIEEFDRLTNLTNKLFEIDPISKFEIGLNDELNHREYLAQDLIFQAKNTNQTELIQKAFDLVPDSIGVQNLAKELSLLPDKVLKHDVGVEVENDRIKLLARKGDKVPSVYSTILRTSYDNQITSKTKIVYGNKSYASKNKVLQNIEFTGIPALPKGKAKIKFTFSIDKDGSAIIEQLSLLDGRKITRKVIDLNLIK